MSIGALSAAVLRERALLGCLFDVFARPLCDRPCSELGINIRGGPGPVRRGCAFQCFSLAGPGGSHSLSLSARVLTTKFCLLPFFSPCCKGNTTVLKTSSSSLILLFTQVF